MEGLNHERFGTFCSAGMLEVAGISESEIIPGKGRLTGNLAAGAREESLSFGVAGD